MKACILAPPARERKIQPQRHIIPDSWLELDSSFKVLVEHQALGVSEDLWPLRVGSNLCPAQSAVPYSHLII